MSMIFNLPRIPKALASDHMQTQPDDERFDAQEVMQYPVNERLKAMLLSSDVLPTSLLYNVGLRLTESGERMNWWFRQVWGGMRCVSFRLCIVMEREI